MEEKCPFVREKMGTNFLGSPNSMDFAKFSHAMENWWGNPCISHIIKYTIECESNWEKAPYYGKSMSTNFPVSPHSMGFVGYYWEPIFQTFLIRWVWLSFPMLWEIMRKHMYFAFDEAYHIKWESNDKKKCWYYRKSMSTSCPGSPHSMGFVTFSCSMGNWWGNPFPIWWSIPKDGNRMGKNHPYCGTGKV